MTNESVNSASRKPNTGTSSRLTLCSVTIASDTHLRNRAGTTATHESRSKTMSDPEAANSDFEPEHCPCGDVGYFVDAHPYTGEPEQVQCEFCYTNPKSVFFINNNLKGCEQDNE